MRSGTGPGQIREGTAKGHLARSAARIAGGKNVWLLKGSFGRVASPRCCFSQHSPLRCLWTSNAKHWFVTSELPGQKDHMLQAGDRPQVSRGRSGHQLTAAEPGRPQARAWA